MNFYNTVIHLISLISLTISKTLIAKSHSEAPDSQNGAMAQPNTCRDFYLTELQGAAPGGGGRNDPGMWADSSATTISIVICAGVPRLSLVGFHHLHGSVVGPSPAAGGCAATAASDRNNRQCAAPPPPHLIRRDSSASRNAGREPFHSPTRKIEGDSINSRFPMSNQLHLLDAGFAMGLEERVHCNRMFRNMKGSRMHLWLIIENYEI